MKEDIKKSIPLRDLIRVRDEKVNMGDSKYYYYYPDKNTGIVIEYNNFEDSQYEVGLSELFRNNKDISNCKEGIKGRLIYINNRLECEDYKESEKTYFKNNIGKLNELLILFSTTHEMFLRKMKIFKVLY